MQSSAMTCLAGRSNRANTPSYLISNTTVPAPGKGGTGVFSVDGKELAKKTMKHTIPMLMAIDETFDVGLDTRTGVDNSYELPFKFTGTIDKLTFKLGASQLTKVEEQAAAETMAMAHD